jgi:hypothetical protein
MSKKLQQPQIDLKSTTGFEDENGNKIFQQGFILRKVSKFVAGTDEDAIMPIPVFFEPKTGKMVGSTLHPDLKDEYADDCI